MNTYEMRRAKLVEDFINTHDPFLDEPEHLRKPEDLGRFLKLQSIEHGEQVTGAILEQVCRLRSQLRDCWLSETVEEFTEALNPLLGQTLLGIQIEPDEDNLALRFDIPPETSLIEQLTIECARGLITLVQHHGLERMRFCAAEPCQDVFVDTSRNKSRRFCSDRCANRYNVAAFRDRQRDTNGD
ncbi:MAG: CGNR zinc finger domain-containing protein [Chloroflexi bacterium]|nr:CGNR zinc finger domain-containing protein [Chloroflexota bacterium]